MEFISSFLGDIQKVLDTFGQAGWLKDLHGYVNVINSYVWGWPMLFLILGVGFYLTVGLLGRTIFKIPFAFRMLWRGRNPQGEGEISPFNALMTSLSATMGTGNIAGVATAIAVGGPGAVFWMWMTALVGMATKYSEAVLAVHYRETDERGKHVGGPMYYIRNGLGEKFGVLATILAVLFALFASIAGFGIGNMVQSNSVASALDKNFGIPVWGTGLVMMVMVFGVLIGGIEVIAKVAGKLVPVMAIAYILACSTVLIIFADKIPGAFALIVSSAFTTTAATGGFLGAAMMLAIRQGVARGVFSNEAGLGSAPIAHAAAQTHGPVSQGLVAMLGTFIDTLIVCTFTGLAIVASGVWSSGTKGAALTTEAFASALPELGGPIVAISISIFAFTTILGWSYYCERSLQYLLGSWIIYPFRIVWSFAVFVGATLKLGFVWALADTLNAMMAIPNLIALGLLAPVVFKLTKAFFESRGASENNPF